MYILLIVVNTNYYMTNSEIKSSTLNTRIHNTRT